MMMPLRRALGLVCLISAAACLAAGYRVFGLWVDLPVVLITFLVCLSAWKWPSTWMPTLALSVIVGLAAAGVLTGASPLIMIVCSTLGLAGWDLVILERALSEGSTREATARLEKKHFTSLWLALIPGLLVAAAGHLVRFQVPFGVMILLVILAFFCLIQIWSLLTGKA